MATVSDTAYALPVESEPRAASRHSAADDPVAPLAPVLQKVPQEAPRESFLLQLNQPAPYFEGRSTQGFTRLSDFAGHWLVLFCHPADFTPDCASEFVSFGRASDAFARLDCQLLGLSVDSVFAPLAWRESIRDRFGVGVGFPILEDVALTISRRHGMVHRDQHVPHPSDVRALFVIDRAGLLRAMLYYPLTTGRSVGLCSTPARSGAGVAAAEDRRWVRSWNSESTCAANSKLSHVSWGSTGAA